MRRREPYGATRVQDGLQAVRHLDHSLSDGGGWGDASYSRWVDGVPVVARTYAVGATPHDVERVLTLIERCVDTLAEIFRVSLVSQFLRFRLSLPLAT